MDAVFEVHLGGKELELNHGKDLIVTGDRAVLTPCDSFSRIVVLSIDRMSTDCKSTI